MSLHLVSDLVTDEHGNWVEGAVVVLRKDGAAAAMYADEAGLTAIAQATTGADGRYAFYAPFGVYRVEATVRGVTRGVDGVPVGFGADAADFESFGDYVRAEANKGLTQAVVAAGAAVTANKASGKRTVVQALTAPCAVLLPKDVAVGWTHLVAQSGPWPVLLDVEPGAAGRTMDGPLPVQLGGDGDVANVVCVGNNPGLTAAEFVVVLGGS